MKTKRRRPLYWTGLPLAVAVVLLLALFMLFNPGAALASISGAHGSTPISANDLAWSPVVAADALPACPTDLFFSEYIEGSSYNKALEIYNGTGSDITFTGQYEVRVLFNGSTTAASTFTLDGATLASGDVYVIANSSADQAILDVADALSSVANFNGDDAVTLYKNGVPIDVIGQIGFDPGSYWGTDPNTTQNHTLVRKSTIMSGDTDGSDAFDPASEWDAYAQDTTTYLGAHVMDSCAVPPDLSVAKSGVRYIMPGDPITYTIHVQNTGIPVATNVKVTDTLPVSTTYVSQSSSYDVTNPEPGVYVWDVGDLSDGGSADIALTVASDSDAPAGKDFVNTAEISSDAAEDDYSNNTTQWTTTVFDMVPIHDIQFVDDPANSDASSYAGQAVWVEGIVTAKPGEIDTGTSTFAIEDPAGGPWSGLVVYNSSGFPTLAAPEGTLVRVLGTVEEKYGVTRLNLGLGPSAVEVVSSGNPVPAPEVIPTGDYSSAATAEQWEGVLIEFQNASVTDADIGYGEWTFDDGSGVTAADDLGDVDGNMTYIPQPNDVYKYIRGIGWYSFSVYKLEPRYTADVKLLVLAPEITKSAPVIVQPGEPITYTIKVRNAFDYDLTNVVIVDDVPENTVFAAAYDGGVESDGTVSWVVGDLSSYTTVNVRFVVTAPVSPMIVTNQNYAVAASNFLTYTYGTPVQTIVDTALHIHHIQGPGDVSPFVDQTVDDVSGIVTDIYYKDDAATSQIGFFMQDPAPDADPATSEGIYVYTNNAYQVEVGEGVTVSGLVDEYYDLTEITDVTGFVTYTADTSIAPTVVHLPVNVGETLEPYEGMLVTLPETLTVSQNYFQGRYGQVTLSADGRMYNPTNGNGLGDTFEYDQRRMIVLDDGINAQNPDPIPYIGQADTLRAGDTTSNLTGVIDYGQITSSSDSRYYRIQPTTEVTFTRVNTRTTQPSPVGGNLKVASMNVLNYFTTIDDGSDICGPSGNLECRGADSTEEFTRQRDKIFAALSAMDADVVGLIEIENNGDTAISDLVSGLNNLVGADTYDFISDPAFIGTDAIKVALIYKPASVTPVGESLSSTDPIFDRPPVAQTFRQNSSGEKFTVVVNHFKSKGSCPADPTDPNADQGDGQGCWNQKRVEQAQALLGFISDLKSSSGDPDVLVIGDLNSYGVEDPILTLTGGGLVNQVAAHVDPAERYSYVFDGLAGYLDHALTTSSLGAQVTGATIWHINADEPSVIDYNLEYKPQDLYTSTAYRSSDHDPVVIGLDLASPKLKIMKSVTPSEDVALGSVVTYTVTLSNAGTGTATQVVLSDTLPSAVEFGGWVTQSEAIYTTGVITWSGDLLADTARTWVFTATVGIKPELAGQVVTNTAAYASDNAGADNASVNFTIERRFILYLPMISKMFLQTP